MTITQLRYFNSVCEYMNVTRASKELHVSQPSISNAIRDLEKELEVALFFRVKKRLVLTREGEFLYDQAQKILQEIDALKPNVQDLGGKRNLLRIGIPPMIGTLYFPKILTSFRKAYPDIHIEVEEYGSIGCRERVLDDRLDLAIIITNDADTMQLNYITIMDTEMMFYVSKDHPLAALKTVGIQDIKDYDLVLLPPGSYNRELAIKLYKGSGLTPKVLLHSSQINTIQRILQTGTAGAFMFRGISDIDNTGSLKAISFSPELPTIHIGVAWKRTKRLFSDAIRFIDFVKEDVSIEDLRP